MYGGISLRGDGPPEGRTGHAASIWVASMGALVRTGRITAGRADRRSTLVARVAAGVRPVFLFRNDLPVRGLFATQALEQVRDDLAHVGQVTLEVFGPSFFC